MIFKRLANHRHRANREFFCCELPVIIETIENVLTLQYKEMMEELGIKDYNMEYAKFFKAIIKRTEKSKYDRVYVSTLHLSFMVWCRAKNIKTGTKPTYDEFCEKLVEQKYRIKKPDNDDEYLEKMIYKMIF